MRTVKTVVYIPLHAALILPWNNQDSAVLYAKTKVAVAVITVDGAWTVSCGRGLGCETAVRPYTLMTHVHQPPWYICNVNCLHVGSFH